MYIFYKKFTSSCLHTALDIIVGYPARVIKQSFYLIASDVVNYDDLDFSDIIILMTSNFWCYQQ
jgi:hypothetical protein